MSTLLEAYKTTRYIVFEPELIVEIEKYNQNLNDLLKTHSKETWAYITAYNPFSKTLTDDENLERHIELKALTRKYVTFEGHGIGLNSSWKPEKSLLILGIDKIEAIKIGNHFEQNAIVYGDIQTNPEIFFLNKNLF